MIFVEFLKSIFEISLIFMIILININSGMDIVEVKPWIALNMRVR